MKIVGVVSAGCFAASISGCALPDNGVTGDPKTITLQAALEDVVTSLAAMKEKLNEKGETLGTFPCKITTVFNLVATGSVTSTGGGTLGVAFDGATASGNYSRNASATGTRGNQITIELDSVACLSKDTLGATKPENIDKLWTIMANLKPNANLTNNFVGTEYGAHKKINVK